MQYRDLLEPGKAVLLMLTAEAQGDDVRARIQTVEPLDAGGGEDAEGPARVRQLGSADRKRRQAARAGAHRPARSANDKGDAEIR